MYIDNELVLDSAAEHLTTESSDNVIDLQNAYRNIGTGEDLYIVVAVTTAMSDAGSDSTMTAVIEMDDNEAFASATTAQTLGTFAATSAAGTRLIAKLQPEAITERYIRVGYTVANGDLTTGNFDAFITPNIDAYTAYPSGFEVES